MKTIVYLINCIVCTFLLILTIEMCYMGLSVFLYTKEMSDFDFPPLFFDCCFDLQVKRGKNFGNKIIPVNHIVLSNTKMIYRTQHQLEL